MIEALGELVEDPLAFLGLATEHQGVEEAPGRRARVQAEPSSPRAQGQSDSSPAGGATALHHPSLLPREGPQLLPERTVQALASKLEEGQVLLSHRPAEVVAVEGKWG